MLLCNLKEKFMKWLRNKPQIFSEGVPSADADTMRELPGKEENTKKWFTFKIRF